jgi:hypothetical protein
LNHNTLWPQAIGDPTPLGWGTAAAYLVAGWACWRAASHSARGAQTRGLAAWWGGFAVLMLVLGVNKELDLQAWLAAFGKSMAHEQGWYMHRRTVQTLFVSVCTLAAAGGLAWALYRARALLARLALPLAGLGLIAAYATLHVVSVHLWRVPPGGAGPIWLLELGGVVLVGAGAWRDRTAGRARP